MSNADDICAFCGEADCEANCTGAILAAEEASEGRSANQTGLSRNPLVWAQRVDLNLTLFQALTAQGLLLLALRHPGTQGPGLPRQTGEELVAVLSRMLMHGGALTEATLRGAFVAEAGSGGMTWADFDAACARLAARVAAMGQQNPDTEG